MDHEILPVPSSRVPVVAAMAAMAAMTARAFADDPLLRRPRGDVPDPLAAIEAEFLAVQTTRTGSAAVSGRP